MNDTKLLTRQMIIDKINDLLAMNVSTRDFGNDMFFYLANIDNEYKYEEEYEELIEEILTEFMDMHDAGKKTPGYTPQIPSTERLKEIKNLLKGKNL